ncbi:MAG: phospholipase A [Sphingomonas sp.]
MIATLVLTAALAVQAAPPTIPSSVTIAADGSYIVEVTALNPGGDAIRNPLVEALSGSLTTNGRTAFAMLDRIGGADATIAPRGFSQARYRLRAPEGAGAGPATLRLGGADAASGLAFTIGSQAVAPEPVPHGVTAASPVPAFNPDPPAAKPDTGNAFLGNLSSYTPIYAVYGPGTNSDARIQIGFKYQLFGSAGAVGEGGPWVNGVHFGYSQRIFWDLGKKSSPFRNVEYLPELFYLLPARPVGGDGLQLGAQAGIRHESNGRDGLDSRSVNTIYVQPVATTRLGDHTLTVGPRAWVYVGSLEDNPDIKRYRGNTGLLAEIGRPDSWRLTTTTRYNFGSGKGSFDAEASYPLDRVFDTSLNLYVFGQGFVGYGENLFDYNRRATRLRIGFGFVR